MRLSVNLEPDLYALAKSLARAEDCSISSAVNKLLRRSLERPDMSRGSGRPAGRKRNKIVVSPGRRPITPDTVREIEAEDDQR